MFNKTSLTNIPKELYPLFSHKLSNVCFLFSFFFVQQFLFGRVCSKRKDYHATVNKYVMELYEEKKKQHQLQVQIQCLKKFHSDSNKTSSQELNAEVWQSLHLNTQV